MAAARIAQADSEQLIWNDGRRWVRECFKVGGGARFLITLRHADIEIQAGETAEVVSVPGEGEDSPATVAIPRYLGSGKAEIIDFDLAASWCVPGAADCVRRLVPDEVQSAERLMTRAQFGAAFGEERGAELWAAAAPPLPDPQDSSVPDEPQRWDLNEPDGWQGPFTLAEFCAHYGEERGLRARGLREWEKAVPAEVPER
eukprot:TRINITY_DN23046_c0_g1_i3.p1 TRINITY_DN23046_c0_g1~~TRINITY_DN23046_c0_g1_i3.p1  ORF type:complete len:201 (+),score=58.69 TRINITY_DN23046_c0_g1_i3:404-1006(+)